MSIMLSHAYDNDGFALIMVVLEECFRVRRHEHHGYCTVGVLALTLFANWVLASSLYLPAVEVH